MNALRSIAGSSLALLLFGASLAPAQGQAAITNAPSLVSHRHLIVLDTSRSMKARLPSTVDLVNHVISSGMDGRMRRGDTVGLWTFGSELRTGGYPLQIWSPERRQSIVLGMVSYIQNARIGGSTALRAPLAAVLELVKESDAITTLFITDGESLFRGTPFDEEINAAIKRSERPMRSAGLPFAVFLVGRGGKLTTFAVNSAFKPLAYPEVEPARTEPTPAPTPVAKEPTPVVPTPPVEAKPEPKPTETATVTPPQTEVPKPQPAQPETTEGTPVQPTHVIPATGALQTTEKGSVVLPQPVFTGESEPNPRAEIPATKTDVVQPASTVAEMKPVATEPKPETFTTTEKSAATIATATNEQPGTTNTVPVALPSQPVASLPSPVEVPAPPVTTVITSSTPAVVVTEPVLPTPPLSLTATEPSRTEAQPGVAAVPVNPIITATTQSVEIASSTAIASPPSGETNLTSPQLAASTALTNAPAPILAAIPPEASYSPRAMLIAAFGLLAVAVGLILLMLRRRAPAGASIITRSMDHDKQ